MSPEDITEGQSVVYRAHPEARAEDGRVVRLGERPDIVFVLYRGDSTPKATRVADLSPVEIS